MTSKSNSNPKCIDLFYGAGGLSKGFEDAGYDILLGVDHDEASIKTFNDNHSSRCGIVADLKSVSPRE
jgi:DNA (cytosine-5)-methyltransferase 1